MTRKKNGAKSNFSSLVASVAHSLHKSLILEDILRTCRSLLDQTFPLGRFTFVQHRASETTATFFSLDPGETTRLIGPKVIPFEGSRINECVIERKRIFFSFGSPSEQDGVERAHLLQPDASMVVYSPLLLQNKLKGILVLELRGQGRLTSSQRLILALIVRQMPLAIENSDTLYMERRRMRQMALISDIAKQAVMFEDLYGFLRGAAEQIRNGFDYNVVQIWTLNQRQELELSAHVSAVPMESSGRLLLPMIQECCTFSQTYCNNNLVLNGSQPAHGGTASHLVVPIRLRNKILGVLSLESRLPDAFSEQDQNVMEGISSIIASTFDNRQTLVYAQQSNPYLQAILECAKDRAILSTDIHGHVLTCSAGVETVFHLSPQEVVGRNILSLFPNPGFQSELALYINHTDRPTFERSRLSQPDGNTSAFLDVNLQRIYDAGKRPIGFLCMVRDVTELVHLQNSLEALSVTDALTGLFNQRRFFLSVSDEVERCRRFNRTFSVCFFDLDGFKQFNDTKGHIRGDQALKETAKLIRTLVRAGVDTCYRYGGDEFTIIMPETTGDRACLVVERILHRLSQHFSRDITASVGVAEFVGSGSAEEMVDRADRAMYTAKAAGGNRVVAAD